MEDRWQTLPLALNAFDSVRDMVTARAGCAPQVKQALLACDEWIANVVAYSGATRLECCLALGEHCLRISFSDDGIPFDPTSERDDLDDFDALDRGGMGLILIQQAAFRMEYARRKDRNVLSLWFALDEGALKPDEEGMT